MDLLDFSGDEGDPLYFEEDQVPEVNTLLDRAAQNYGKDIAEQALLRAFFLAPHSLAVLVSLYRFYYYQHRYQDTLVTAQHAMRVSGNRLDFPDDWRNLTPQHIQTTNQSMGLMRFYLLALKGAAYVKLRLGEMDDGEAMIDKVMLLDPEDRLGASVLKNVLVEQHRKPHLVVAN